MTHEQALEAIRATLEAAPAPVSIAVVDDHGELVACLAMDGAARDTLENARRKAYTAARSDAPSTRALAEKVADAPDRARELRSRVLVLLRRCRRVLGRASCRRGRRQRASRDRGRAAGGGGNRRGRPAHSLTRKLRRTTGWPGVTIEARAVTHPRSASPIWKLHDPARPRPEDPGGGTEPGGGRTARQDDPHPAPRERLRDVAAVGEPQLQHPRTARRTSPEAAQREAPHHATRSPHDHHDADPHADGHAKAGSRARRQQYERVVVARLDAAEADGRR